MKRLKIPRCKLCAHPERARIEMIRLAGAGLDTIAEQFDISKDSLWRHMRDHVSPDDKAAYLADIPLQEMLARAADEGVSLLDFFKIVRATLMKQFQLAASVNDQKAVAALAGRECLPNRRICSGGRQGIAPRSCRTAPFGQTP
jgi:hypothetical protein